MNKERILALADLIEKQPHQPEFDATSGFDMSCTHRDCGTPACIAGWALWEAQGRPESLVEPPGLWGIENNAATYLGLSVPEVSQPSGYPLFYPPETYKYEGITPAQAASCLRHLAETGEVDWARAMGDA